MATTRIRKAFRYPSEGDDASEPEELDEEHQEKLIADLQSRDEIKNEQYRVLFLAIPVSGALFFLLSLFAARDFRRVQLALLSMSSLLCTAYVLWFLPIKAPERKGKRALYQVEAEKGPVEKYLVYLNALLAGIMLVAAVVSWRRGVVESAWKEALPAIIFALTMVVRQQLAPIDLDELQNAKYELKGA